MTTLQAQESFPKRNVHYRREGQTATFAPSTRANKTADITSRACVPCAIVGHHRGADVLNEVGTPECYPHAEFGALDASKQALIIGAWSSDGAAVGIITMIETYREGNPGWFERCRPMEGER